MAQTKFTIEGAEQLEIPVSIWTLSDSPKQPQFKECVLSSREIDLPEDQYRFCLTMPFGQHVCVDREILSGPNVVSMRVEVPELSSREEWLKRYEIASSKPIRFLRYDFSSDGYRLRQETLRGVYSEFAVNLWKNSVVIIRAQKDESSDLYAVPVSAGLPAIVRKRSEVKHLFTEIRPANFSASILLDYLMSNDNGLAEVASSAELLSPKELLEGKRQDPISAIVGALTLMKLNKWDGIGDWLDRLIQFRPWLPDAIVLHSVNENLRIEQAPDDAEEILIDSMEVLKGLGNRIPIFTDSLTYALNLLRYLDELSSPKANDDLHQLRKRLQLIASYADLSQPVLTLRNVPEQACNEILQIAPNNAFKKERKAPTNLAPRRRRRMGVQKRRVEAPLMRERSPSLVRLIAACIQIYPKIKSLAIDLVKSFFIRH